MGFAYETGDSSIDSTDSLLGETIDSNVLVNEVDYYILELWLCSSGKFVEGLKTHWNECQDMFQYWLFVSSHFICIGLIHENKVSDNPVDKVDILTDKNQAQHYRDHFGKTLFIILFNGFFEHSLQLLYVFL